MADISLLLHLASGSAQNVDLSVNNLLVGGLKVQGVALSSFSSGNAGSKLIGDDNSYSHFTSSANTVKGALSGIDTAIGSISSSVISAPLEGSFQQGPDLLGVNGTSLDVSSQLAGKVASSGSTVKGVVVTAPDNKVILRTLGDTEFIDDTDSNQIYGRLTFSSGVWTLSFFSNIGGVETPWNFSDDVRWYYQELFQKLVDSPVYSELAFLPSNNTSRDIRDASSFFRGLVNTTSQQFAGDKTLLGNNTLGTDATTSQELHGGVAIPDATDTNGLFIGIGSFSQLFEQETLQQLRLGSDFSAASLRMEVAEDSTTNGTSQVLGVSLHGTVILSNAGLVSIKSIRDNNDNQSSNSGRLLVIRNLTGGSVTFLNESGAEATAVRRISTPTGADFVLPNGYSAIFQYNFRNPGNPRWAMISAAVVTLTGDVTGTISGSSISTTVGSVGGSSSSSIHSAELAANAATSANTPTTIVKRDGSGNFSAGTITATLSGNATNVSGTVAIANGGTGQTTKTSAFDALSPNSTLGDITYHNGTNNVRLPGNTTTAKQFLIQTGNGSVSAAPSWGAIASADLPTITLTGDVTGSASGGSISTTIASNVVTNAKLAQAPANTVKGNNTGSTANVTDVSLVSSASASSAMYRDTNTNTQINTIIENIASTATAAGTTTLTVSSSPIQIFTGSTTQTVVLPNATTLSNGHRFVIINRSTGLVTVNTNGGATIATLAQGSTYFRLTNNGTSAGTWDTNSITGLADIQTISNKTFGDAITLTQISTPSNPASGFNKIYTKSDNNLYTLTSAGTETQVGTGSGGGTKNYLGTVNAVNGNGNFELGSTTKWSLFNTTLTGVIPTGAISAGAASITTFNTVSSGQLAGSFSLQTASSGAWTAGQGVISDAFTIDIEDQAKMMTFKAYYKVVSGAANANFSGTSSNTFAVYIYDTTNSAWIQPAGVYGITQNSGVGYVTGDFQTTSNSTQYRIAVIAANASSGAVTMYWDDFFLGPETAPMGPALTDWATDTGFVPVGFGTVASQSIQKQRVGDSYLVRGFFVAGTVAGTTASITLPFSIDTSKLTSSTNAQRIGTWTNLRPAGAQNISSTDAEGPIFYDGSTTGSVFFAVQSGATQLSKAAGTGFLANAAGVSIEFEVPVAGFSSNVQMSNDTDTRVVAAAYTSSSGQTITSGSVVNFENKSIDTHGAVTTGASWKFTVPVSGIYSVTGNLQGGSTIGSLFNVNIRKNGTGTNINSTATGSTTNFGIIVWTGLLNCVAGDTIDAILSNDSGNPINTTDVQINIHRLSGPSVIASTESVNASYTSNNTPALGTSQATLSFNTKNYDSHNAFSGTTFTVPISGKYEASAVLTSAVVTLSTSQQLSIQLFKNGVFYADMGLAFGNGTSQAYRVSGSAGVSCVAGDTLQVQASAGVATTLFATLGFSHVEFKRIGN